MHKNLFQTQKYIIVFIVFLGFMTTSAVAEIVEMMEIPGSNETYEVMEVEVMGDYVAIQVLRKGGFGSFLISKLFNCSNQTYSDLTIMEGRENMREFKKRTSSILKKRYTLPMKPVEVTKPTQLAFSQYACKHI